MAILSEGYSNAPFDERLDATYVFVREILSLAAEEQVRIAEINRAADAWRPDSVSVRAEFAPPTTQDVIAEITEPAGDGTGPFARRVRSGTYRTVAIPVYDRFSPRQLEAVPAGYLLPPRSPEAVALLLRHGIVVRRLGEPWIGMVEAFPIDSVVVAGRAFQGHRTVRVYGNWQQRDHQAEPGWYYVSTDQRLGTLAAYLLEPASADGLVNWNVFDRDVARGREYPVVRLSAPPLVPSAIVVQPLD